MWRHWGYMYPSECDGSGSGGVSSRVQGRVVGKSGARTLERYEKTAFRAKVNDRAMSSPHKTSELKARFRVGGGCGEVL